MGHLLVNLPHESWLIEDMVTANLVTGVIVIAASRIGLPVSTTHVSCGTLFGIGATTGVRTTK